MKHITLDPENALPPTRHLPTGRDGKSALPDAKETKLHPRNPPGGGGENARLMFVGTATTVLYVCAFTFFFERGLRRERGGVPLIVWSVVPGLILKDREWEGVRLMTDPVCCCLFLFFFFFLFYPFPFPTRRIRVRHLYLIPSYRTSSTRATMSISGLGSRGPG